MEDYYSVKVFKLMNCNTTVMLQSKTYCPKICELMNSDSGIYMY